jgi:sulfatase maturation enzyme AslB (radical SAM superfamily)
MRVGGGDTYDNVMTASKRLLTREVDYGMLAVVTSYSARYPDEVFEFFVDNELIDRQISHLTGIVV